MFKFLVAVFALWKVPELLPAFLLKGGEVSRFVIGGADLMFPGISMNSDGLPNFLAGEPWAVKVPGNPAPIAVGATTMSSTEALKAGLRGKALKICHYYRDSLWESAEGRYVPNAGFLEDVVFEDPSFSSTCQPSDSFQVESLTDQETTINDKELGNHTDSNINFDHASTSLSNLHIDEQTTGASELKGTENVPADQISDEEQQTLSTEDVDALLDKCLLQSLFTTVKDKDLPMAGSTLW